MSIITLSVRRDGGPDVADEIQGDVSRLEQGNGRTAVILIHGYDVSEKRAKRTYRRWYRDLSDLFLGGVWPATVDVYGFHWPGSIESDESWITKLKSKSSFSNRFGRASESGRMLGALFRRSTVDRIILVAHSLGNRVALTSLRCLPNEAVLPKVSRVVMMAAAVAEGDCMNPVRPGQSTSNAPLFCRQVMERSDYWNLFSRNDAVLGLLFRFEASRDGQSRPAAIGYTGGPDKRWDNVRHLGVLHGQYWSNEFAHAVAGEAIQPRSVRIQPPERRLTGRELSSRSLPPPQEIAQRTLP